MNNDDKFACDTVTCPSCRDGKRGVTMCPICSGSGELPALTCIVCKATPSTCTCPIPCGKGRATHRIHGRSEQLSPCGRPAVGMIAQRDWRSILLMFDPVNTLADAMRCAEHAPHVNTSATTQVTFDAFELTEDGTLGNLRRILCRAGWDQHSIGRLWQPSRDFD